jgi:hypothetical protein
MSSKNKKVAGFSGAIQIFLNKRLNKVIINFTADVAVSAVHD